MANSKPKETPAMAQYRQAKEEHPDSLLFFRMGDFYELFWDDAKRAAERLGITLTARGKGDNSIPMAGVPVRSLDTYLERLVRLGERVAICEQMQDPKEAKGVVERQVVRVVTPGTLTEDGLLGSSDANFLAAVTTDKDHAGLAWVELSTGSFQVVQCDRKRLEDELTRVDAAEILVSEDVRDEMQSECAGLQTAWTRRNPQDFSDRNAKDQCMAFFGMQSLDAFDLEDWPIALRAAGALIRYLDETQKTALPHIRRIERYEDSAYVRLDRATRQSLELVDTMRGEGTGTPLLKILDKTRTPMGKRLLRDWVLAPLQKLHAIHERQAAVRAFFDQNPLLEDSRSLLGSVLDLQRLTARISTGRANARDLVGLRQSLEVLPSLKKALTESGYEPLVDLSEGLDPQTELATRLRETLVDEPPTTIKEGGIIREGFREELDELRTLARDSRTWLSEYQAREAERIGVPNLKIGFNRVFGYYLEITHGNKGVELPDDYVRRQTMKNAERYVTAELKEFEDKVLSAEDRAQELEYDLFVELRDAVSSSIEGLLSTALWIGRIDCLQSLATVARDRNYCCPRVDDSSTLKIEDGRHPVLEATHAQGEFVPNDTDLDPPERTLALLTGPNMAGKSTYIRQNALIALLAQIGSFVPAREAHCGLVDRIFARVGASDDISRGASTFMVEMTETANILHNATERSLVILDEVGRGTSTFDGLALAWSIAEDLHDRIGCRALFATHYHQITALADSARGVFNCRVGVREWGDEIVFLHRIEAGATDRSYGLHVGRLAGIPDAVLTRARSVLDELETENAHVGEALDKGRHTTPQTKSRPPMTAPSEPAEQAPEERSTEPEPDVPARQLSLFEPARDRVARRLEGTRLDDTTPLQAFNLLQELIEDLRADQKG
ncbi:MAG: DNA mismatch repair protein MutS [Planctomycetota bacterium]